MERYLSDPDTVRNLTYASEFMAESIRNGGKVISCGNGGSCCDAAHFAEELTGRYRCNRRPLPAICINDPSHLTCTANDFGFDSNEGVTSKTRECKTTDYARAKGAWYNTKTDLKYNGTYWTRSSSNDFSYCAWNVNSAGFLSEYAVDGNSHCVRPAITISL